MYIFRLIKKYFDWLQKDNPTGKLDMFAELSRDSETSVKGVFIAGDLTGVPLLKTSVKGGRKLVEEYIKSSEKMAEDLYDIVIIGAGPAGVSAGIEASKRGLKYIILEASARPFQTIYDFPKGKPMVYAPKEMEQDENSLVVQGERKEDLLKELCDTFEKYNLNVGFESKVEKIEARQDGENITHTADGRTIRARRTILAIGKSGNHRKLKVQGVDLPHVFYVLRDASEYSGKRVLVIGGGDSALETSIMLAKAGAKVVHSYRKTEFTRPKPANIIEINNLKKDDKIKILYNSNVREVRSGEVDITIDERLVTEKIDVVFIKIGNEQPIEFFNKSGIKIANVKTKMTYWWMAFAVSFMNIIYFGKLSEKLTSSNDIREFVSSIFTGSVLGVVPKVVAWISIIVLVFSGVVIAKDLITNFRRYFRTKWFYIKHAFFVFTIVLFLVVFLGNKYFEYDLWGRNPYFWYSFLYTMTIGIFGLRRILVNKVRYVTYQTITLFLIQAIPLFFIPNFILPWMNEHGLISQWIFENIFLGGEWWRFVGFILAWPLFIWNVFTDEPSTFWLIVSFIQTFVIIPWLIFKFGKGAYCSWICSCGAMAETLGDEYRTLAPHGEKAKKWENSAQVVLFAIIIVTIFHFLGWIPQWSSVLLGINRILLGGYQIIVDTILAGTIGVGLYFFYGGRMWCRFFCPLAGLMNIYNKFSSWRILSDKKKCISCGLCTRECHMGIDVMAYAQQGKPVDDTQCVNCSACINVCPTGAISFGRYKKFWGNKRK